MSATQLNVTLTDSTVVHVAIPPGLTAMETEGGISAVDSLIRTIFAGRTFLATDGNYYSTYVIKSISTS